jgi:hypothetical protein
MILVLGEGGYLKLPETGLQVQVVPGDVVFFTANQQLHKLDVNPASPNAPGVQTVFTLWADQPTMAFCQPTRYQDSEYKDFYCVEPEPGDILREADDDDDDDDDDAPDTLEV